MLDAWIFWIYVLMAALSIIVGIMASFTFWDLVMDRRGSVTLYGLSGAVLGFFSFLGASWVMGAVV